MAYRAAVFDLDGTLLNTLADLADSGNELLASYGMAPHPEPAFRYFVGNGSRKLMERILPGKSPEQIDEALARYKAIYEKHLTAKTTPYAGISETLSALKARGVRMAVCTNKHISAAEALIRKYFPADTFDAFEGDRSGVPRKPDPAHVRIVLEKMGVRPEETVYLGDSGVDMQTAVNAGALPVGVLWGFREKDELMENGAQILLSKPSELLEKVDFVKNGR
jgi:phosphoglycolate phosphatase